MPAVYIDAAVVDGSRNRLTPSPAYPIVEPDLLLSIASASIATPSAIPFVSGVALSAPSAFSVIAAATYSAPSLITRIADPTLTAPSVITPKAGTSDTPPYPLNHARILYNNLLIASVATSSTGTNPSYVLTPNTYQSWRFSTGGWIKLTLLANQNIDTVTVAAHNLGSAGYTVHAYYRTGVSGSLTSFASAKSPTKNKPIMFHRSSAVNARVIEIHVSGSTSAAGIGSIYAGVALQMQRPFFSGFDRYGDQSTLSTRMSAGGNIIAREVIRLGYSNTFKFEHLTDSWMQNYFEPFKYAAKTTPFAIAWNLLEYPDDVFFGMVDADINPVFMGIRNLYSAEFSMVSHGTI